MTAVTWPPNPTLNQTFEIGTQMWVCVQTPAEPAGSAGYAPAPVWDKVGGTGGTGSGGVDPSKLPLAGGTMTGDIVLKGPATLPLHPATKAQLDAVADVIGSQAAIKKPDATDLNTLLETGRYLVLGAINSYSNSPTHEWEVQTLSIDAGRVFQIARVAMSPTQFVRSLSGTQWSAWLRVASDLNAMAQRPVAPYRQRHRRAI
jgi:hypothetical protein